LHERRLKAAIERKLRDGPCGLEGLLAAAQQEGLLAAAQQEGVRGADLGMVWEVVHSYGLGDVVGEIVIPHGWIDKTDTSAVGPSSEHEQGGRRPRSGEARPELRSSERSAVPGWVRSEVNRLRRDLDLTGVQQHAGVRTADPEWSRCVAQIKTALEARAKRRDGSVFSRPSIWKLEWWSPRAIGATYPSIRRRR
jgi:hypothetical protein